MWCIRNKEPERQLREARGVCWSHTPEGWGQDRKYPKVESARDTPILEYLCQPVNFVRFLMKSKLCSALNHQLSGHHQNGADYWIIFGRILVRGHWVLSSISAFTGKCPSWTMLAQLQLEAFPSLSLDLGGHSRSSFVKNVLWPGT